VQVKGTELQNKSTNNPISNLEKEFDYLIIVVFDGETPHYYILTKSEATQAYGKKLGTIYTSQMVDRVYQVKPEISRHKDKWEKIIGGRAAP
jgi:hypothetical protein